MIWIDFVGCPSASFAGTRCQGQARLRRIGEYDVTLGVGSRWPSRDMPYDAGPLTSHGYCLGPSLTGNQEVTRHHSCSGEIGPGQHEDAIGTRMSVARNRTIGEVGRTLTREPGWHKPFTLDSDIASVRQSRLCHNSSVAPCVDRIDRSANLIWGDELSGESTKGRRCDGDATLHTRRSSRQRLNCALPIDREDTGRSAGRSTNKQTMTEGPSCIEGDAVWKRASRQSGKPCGVAFAVDANDGWGPSRLQRIDVISNKGTLTYSDQSTRRENYIWFGPAGCRVAMPSSCEINETSWAEERQASCERERQLSVPAWASEIDDRRDVAK
jgi:hypothetical protein